MPHTDSVTSMLTVYAVARRGQLADSLFYYPLEGGARTLRPGKVHSWLQPDSVLYKVTRNSANYQLTGFLLDRNLSEFARYLPEYYPADSLRPRYYKRGYENIAAQEARIKTCSALIKKGSYASYYYAK